MHVLITGGAGFIGSNLARRFIARGARVTLIDNHSRARLLGDGRPGAPDPGRWRGLDRVEGIRVVDGDVCDASRLLAGLPAVSATIHCAGQVGIGASLADPVEDARNNVIGTVALIEALAGRDDRGPLVLFSSNKVYGDAVNRFVAELPGGRLGLTGRWEQGISELFPVADSGLTPYGCSKRAAEGYVLDGSRRHGFRGHVLRCSCIYGPGQSGVEDQGWVSHVVRSRSGGRPVRVFGDGRQVRDLLHVDDACALVELLVTRDVPGGIWNAGGGPGFARSFLDVVNHPSLDSAPAANLEFHPSRMFDQRVYVTDSARLHEAVGWQPAISPDAGISGLVAEYSRP